jgi:CBS domain-containing protein
MTVYGTYSEIRELRDRYIRNVQKDHVELNHFHDCIMMEVVKLSVSRLKMKLGPAPSPFSFFLMGSAGRFEQSIWSDQDHGIIYKENSPDAKQYFLTLGKEISEGLFQAGYAFCKGDVMASNPLWCKSFPEWQHQITDWIIESSWESIRHLLIFIDGRSLYGEPTYIDRLRKIIYHSSQKQKLLSRMIDNKLHLKKGVGVLGQFLIETHGTHSGMLNLKEKAFFPYVNSIRLFAIKENIMETSTLSRLHNLSDKVLPIHDRKLYVEQFIKLLNYRLKYGHHSDYESGHFLEIEKLSKEEKREMKNIIKIGTHLYQEMRKLAGKEI